MKLEQFRDRSSIAGLITHAFAAIFAVGGTLGCGSLAGDADDDSETSSIAGAAAPSIGVASPTARSGDSSGSTSRTALGLRLALPENDPATDIPDSPTIDELNETLETNLEDETTAEEIVTQLPATPFGDSVYRAACFGPSLRDSISNSDRPIGDLGIFYRTRDDTTDEACASAQISALTGGDPANANSAILIVQAAVKSYVDANGGLPANSADVLAHLPATDGITFESATLSPLAADSEGRVGYHTSIEMDIDGETSTIELWQTPTSDDNSSYRGLLQLVSAHVPTQHPGSAYYRGLSMLYEEDGSQETYVLETAANRDTKSSDFFDDATGRVDFASAGAQELLNKMIVTQNTDSGAMTLHYAWQAGAMDGATRTFAAQVDGTASGSSGIAWYGYGAEMADLPDDTTSIWPEKMYCNWTSGLSGGTSQPKLQKQVLSRGVDSLSLDGLLVFKADADDLWVYAPTNSCTNGSSYTVSSPGMGSAPDFIVADTAHQTGESKLVNVPIASESGIDAVTIPAYSKP